MCPQRRWWALLGGRWGCHVAPGRRAREGKRSAGEEENRLCLTVTMQSSMQLETGSHTGNHTGNRGSKSSSRGQKAFLLWLSFKISVIKCLNSFLTFAVACRYSVSSSSSSLSILSSRDSDAGYYHCRVQLPGPFNDQIATIHLIIIHRMTVRPQANINNKQLRTTDCLLNVPILLLQLVIGSHLRQTCLYLGTTQTLKSWMHQTRRCSLVRMRAP